MLGGYSTVVFFTVSSLFVILNKPIAWHLLAPFSCFDSVLRRKLNPPSLLEAAVKGVTSPKPLIDRQWDPARKEQRREVYAPPVRWGLLDFMLALPPPPSLPPPASSRWEWWQRSHPDLNLKCSPDLKTASSRRQFPPGPHPRAPDGTVPTPNRKLPTAVFPPGPHPRAPDGTVPTPTASSRRQCSHPDLTRGLQTAVFPPQPQAPDGSVPHRTSTCQNLCQIECQNLCQLECQDVR